MTQPAGALTTWIGEIGAALRGERAADVPCGSCTACCRSSQFVHIAPDEARTLARIPRALLFPAPGLPKGHVVLGYDGRGRCPMLGDDDACTIYADRPRTCRTYDCRVFAATGVEPVDKPLVAEQVRRWRFDLDDPSLAAALRAAAEHVTARAPAAPPTARAVRAVEEHASFLDT